MQSVMKHNFSQSPRADIQRSKFDRSHGLKTTFMAGYLYPIFLDEILPGDSMNCKMTHFARLATPQVPIMDNIYIDTHFFFVPTRLLWDNWQKFNGEQRNPGDSTDFLVPQITFTGGVSALSIGDYFGLPTNAGNTTVSSLPFRAYNLIWNEWFRDQNQQSSAVNDYDDGPDSPTDYFLRPRGKRYDYFTSALPWPQKGPAVSLPLGDSAPVVGIGKYNNVFGPGGTNTWESNGQQTTYANQATIGSSVNDVFVVEQNPASPGYPNIRVDLSEATAATVNALRQSVQIQKLFERDARGGTRYTEIILAHFGVSSPDARLQRPEYLGGGSTPLNMHPVPQTSSSDSDSPQGNLAAYAVSSGTNHGFTKSFTEHGYVIGLVSARADLNYQQGIPRMWSRRTRFDFYLPVLSHLGEQAILNKEIYAQGNSEDNDVFGYQERWAEYRYKNSSVTASFRSNYPQSLDMWHLAQDFADLPLLGDAFIRDNPPIGRILAVDGSQQFIMDSYFTYHCARPLPTYSVPGLMDHF